MATDGRYKKVIVRRRIDDIRYAYAYTHCADGVWILERTEEYIMYMTAINARRFYILYNGAVLFFR